MNSVKIEKLSINELKRVIALHPFMNDFINDNDKEPSWDGEIFLYSDKDLKAEHLKDKVAVQVKGKNDEDKLNKQYISYPVEYKHLRNYCNNGGVCYFVIVISNDGMRSVIFYNMLTPIKLQGLLEGTEDQKPDNKKSIHLNRLKGNASDDLFRALKQFAHDSKEQGMGELVRKSIDYDDMEAIDSVRMTAFSTSYKETLQKINSGEICLFGHRKDADIWFPFSLKIQKQIEFLDVTKVPEAFAVDEVVFYDKFEIETNGYSHEIRFSENLTFDTDNGSINFRAIGTFESLVKDIKFLQAVLCGERFYINGNHAITYNNVKLPIDLRTSMNEIELTVKALNEINFVVNKKVKDFTDQNWNSIKALIDMYSGDIELKGDSKWHMWWWDDKVVPLIIFKDKKGKIKLCNVVATEELNIKITEKGRHYRIPRFCQFKKDIWEKLYDVDDKILLEDLQESDYCSVTEGHMSLIFLELLGAYDITKRKVYYDMAMIIVNRVLGINPNCANWKINKLQMIKRIRALTEKEMQEVEMIEEENIDVSIKCAANILLDNKRNAQKELNRMTEETRKIFMDYPIYSLL